MDHEVSMTKSLKTAQIYGRSRRSNVKTRLGSACATERPRETTCRRQMDLACPGRNTASNNKKLPFQVFVDRADGDALRKYQRQQHPAQPRNPRRDQVQTSHANGASIEKLAMDNGLIKLSADRLATDCQRMRSEMLAPTSASRATSRTWSSSRARSPTTRTSAFKKQEAHYQCLRAYGDEHSDDPFPSTRGRRILPLRMSTTQSS